MDLAAILGLNVLSGIASLVLISLGLAIIFGMMRIINLAHGEFLMLGAYTTVLATNNGVDIWISMLVISPVVVGLIGLLIERTLIRFLYGRLVDTMLATWGLSLFIVGLVTTIFGNTIKGVPTPLGGFQVGVYRSDLYTLFLAFVALVLLAAVYAVMRFTRFGLIARATMQNANMASALGVNPTRVYMVTFGIGAAVTGMAGGLLAPVSGVSPTMGSAFVAKAFITVVGGGASILAGTASASTLFGFLNQMGSYFTTPVYGEVILLIAATVLIRVLPEGITGRFFKGEPLIMPNRSTIAMAVAAAAAAVLAGLAPQVLDTFTVMQLTVFVCMAVLALSLGFIWGFGGILSFGQAAFFGLGGYAYAVAAFNFGDSTLPVLLAVLVPTLFAGLLGYFMFYGRISNVYVGVITLTVTLILFNVFNSTAGDVYRIGAAALGGFNGMPSVPGITLPLTGYSFGPEDNWYLSAGCLILVFVGLKLLLASHFGRVVVAIRENEARASLLGYDPRFYKLTAFMIGGIAGLAGCLYTLWGAFISPTIFGLATSAQTIIWVMIGGLGTLIGPVLGAVAIQYLVTSIGTQQVLDANLVLGIILLVFVLLMPAGVVPTVELLFGKLLARRTARQPKRGTSHIVEAAEQAIHAAASAKQEEAVT